MDDHNLFKLIISKLILRFSSPWQSVHPQCSSLPSWKITVTCIILDFFCIHLVTDCAFWWWLRSITTHMATPVSRPHSSLLWTPKLSAPLSPTLGYNLSLVSCHQRANASLSLAEFFTGYSSCLVIHSVDPDHTIFVGLFCLFFFFSLTCPYPEHISLLSLLVHLSWLELCGCPSWSEEFHLSCIVTIPFDFIPLCLFMSQWIFSP